MLLGHFGWILNGMWAGRFLQAGPGNPALLPEVLKCSGTDLDPPWPKDLYAPPIPPLK